MRAVACAYNARAEVRSAVLEVHKIPAHFAEIEGTQGAPEGHN